MLKIPEPKQLPSGSWRIQIQVNGQKYSITDKDKKVVKQRAKEIYAGKNVDKHIPMTVEKAIGEYIKLKTPVLSPSTILGYTRYKDNYLRHIANINLSKLTQEDVQAAINQDVIAGKSPKTIRNAHGLLSAVLRQFRPNFQLNTTLPQKRPYQVHIPEEEEIKKIWELSKGTVYELPILLGACCGMRMSEIRGLKFSDLDGDRIHVQRALVRGAGAEGKKTRSVEKLTKSYSGDRWIKLPVFVLKLIEKQPRRSEYICPYSENAIYKNYVKFCEEAGVLPTRFHDLRHFEASEAHSIGVPDEYQIKRLGHKTDNMLKSTYRHTLRSKELPFEEQINTRMSEIFSESSHESSHEKEKAVKTSRK